MIFGSFIFFTGFVAVVTFLITRNDDHSSSGGYFLAGRSLSFPLIAGSLLLTNLSTEQMVGLNGAAFTDGFAGDGLGGTSGARSGGDGSVSSYPDS